MYEKWSKKVVFSKKMTMKKGPHFSSKKSKKKYKKVVFTAAPRRNVWKKLKKPLFCIFRDTLRPALGEPFFSDDFVGKSVLSNFTERYVEKTIEKTVFQKKNNTNVQTQV